MMKKNKFLIKDYFNYIFLFLFLGFLKNIYSSNNCCSLTTCNPISFNYDSIKTCCVPLSDAYPMRYYYHTPFAENEFFDDCEWGFKMILDYRYQQSFHGKTLAASIFGTNPLIASYQPDQTPFLAGNELAIGMEQDYCNSNTEINAKLNNNFITFTLNFCRSDSDWYVNLGLPVQRASYSLCCSETVKSDGFVSKGAFAQEYLDTDDVQPDYEFIPSDEIKAIGSLVKYFSGSIIGDMPTRQYAKISPCSISQWALSDVYIQLGYDCFKRDNSLFGFYLRGVIPTSPKLDACWAKNVFSPVLGNAARWEIDLGLNSHIYLWNCDDKYLEVTADAYVGYIGNSDHYRTFDLVVGPMTRYASTKSFVPSLNDLVYAQSTPWVADVTTQCISVGSPVRSEIILDLIYRNCGHAFNIGYNFRGQTEEKTSSCMKINGTYSLNSQGRVQTPFETDIVGTPDLIMGWANWLVTPRSNMSLISTLDISKLDINPEITEVIGVPVDNELLITPSQLNLNSGIMNGQIENVLFAGYKCSFEDYCFNPFIELRGSVGWSTKAHYTPELWDLMIGFGGIY